MVTLADVINHCGFDAEGPECFKNAQRALDASIDHLASIGVDMEIDPLPAALQHAVLLLCGHFVANKSATNADQIRFTPLGVDRLIAPYREVNL